jgi:hypothetical protein
MVPDQRRRELTPQRLGDACGDLGRGKRGQAVAVQTLIAFDF